MRDGSEVSACSKDAQPRSALEAFGLRFVQAYNERDFETGLELSHPDIVAMPAVAHGVRGGYRGHDGLREWYQSMASREAWYEIVVDSMHGVDHEPEGSPNRAEGTLTIFGEMCLDGEPLTPWAAVLVVEDGLIVRQRSYLSTREELEEMGVVAASK